MHYEPGEYYVAPDLGKGGQNIYRIVRSGTDFELGGLTRKEACVLAQRLNVGRITEDQARLASTPQKER